MGSGNSKDKVDIGEDVKPSKNKTGTGGDRLQNGNTIHSVERSSYLYAEKVFRHLHQFRKDGDLCDINIKVNDTSPSFPAHRCIIAAASPYFRRLLLDDPTSDDNASNSDVRKKRDSAEVSERKSSTSSSSLLSPKYSSNKFSNVIHVDFPVSVETMSLILTYMYSGVLETDYDSFGCVLDASIKLQMMELERKCVREIKQRFDIGKFQVTLSLARRLNMDTLADFALLKALQAFDELVEAECFKSVTEIELQELMVMRSTNTSEKSTVSEVQLFNAVLKWQNVAQCKPNKDVIIRLLKSIQYKNIPKATLSGYVLEQSTIKENEALAEEIRKLVGADKKRVLNRLRHQISLSDDMSITKLLVAKTEQPTKPTIIVTGGRLFDQFSSIVHEYGYRKGGFSKEMTRIPSCVSYHGVAVVDNILYVCGGVDTAMTGAPALSTVWAYDPTSNAWETLPSLQHSRTNFYLGRMKDCLVAVGGRSNKTLRSSVEKYCTISRKWEFVASLKLQRYSHAGTNLRNSTIFISGGVVKKMSSNSLMKYESGSLQWQHLEPMRSCRSNHTMAAVKDRIFVFGGEIEKQGISQPVDVALECYTLQADQWHTISEKLNFPNEKDCSCVTMDGLVYLIGGCRGNLTDHRNDVSRYDPDTDTWKQEAKMIRKFRGAGCAVLALN